MAPVEGWPRRCASCGREHFKNPTPVCVVLLPVDDGLLVVRRAIPPGKGELALPGGFVNWGETWQQAGAREVREETGLVLDPAELTLVAAESVAEGALLLFCQAQTRREADLVLAPELAEVQEVVLITAPCPTAFSTHTEQIRRFFELSR